MMLSVLNQRVHTRWVVISMTTGAQLTVPLDLTHARLERDRINTHHVVGKLVKIGVLC